MNSEKPKIFLSYAHIDLGFAKKIDSDLKRYGLDIWFDKESLLPGQDWEKKIKKAIRESDYFIALLSEKCLSKRGFVHSELKFSFEIVEKYFPSDTGIFIIPVRLDNCKPSDAYERLGRLHWIDVFPESEYFNGLEKILQVVSPGTFLLRNQPREVSQADVINVIRKHDLFEYSRNPEGFGFPHKYLEKEIKGEKIIIDELTKLMWQQSGSEKNMSYRDAKKWIDEINKSGYAGFYDWRLPTLEEALSLLEKEKKNNKLYIDALFDKKQTSVWTSDVQKNNYWTWVVNFNLGKCYSNYDLFNDNFIRAVRSIQYFQLEIDLNKNGSQQDE